MVDETSMVLSPNVEGAVAALETRLKTEATLASVLADPLVVDFARDGEELSGPQRGLVATVVSIMQDRLIRDLRRNNAFLKAYLYRQSVISAVFSAQTAKAIRDVYWAPMFTVAPVVPDAGASAKDSSSRTMFQTVVTWGNFTAAGGILILAAALYFTKAYASLKDVVENQGAIVAAKTTELEQTKTSLTKTQQDLAVTKASLDRTDGERTVQAQLAEERLRSIQKLNDEMKTLAIKAGATEELINAQGELTRQSQELTLKTAQAAGLTEKLNGAERRAKDFEGLWAKEQEKSTKLQQQVDVLNGQVTNLRVRLAEKE